MSEVFRLSHRGKAESIMTQYAGRAAIGHVRYATCGEDDRSYAQPFERHHLQKHKWFSFAFNGQLANYAELRDKLLADDDHHLARATDTEIIMHEISRELSGDRRPPLVEVMRNVAQRFDGAYSLVLLNALGEMLIARDPLGIQPLCYAMEGPLFAAASESVALLNLGFRTESIRSLEPGEMITVTAAKFEIERFADSPRRAHCFFEWIYFANVASTMDDRSVYLARKALGEELARLEDVADRRRHDRRAGARHEQGAADAMAYRAGRAVRRGADPQPLRRPHVHRRPDSRVSKAADEVHAAARSAGRQAGAAGRGLDRPLDDDAGADLADSHSGPGARDPRPRGLPADHRAVLLRHRHVDDRRAVRAAIHARRPAASRKCTPRWPASWAPIRCATCRSSRSPAPSIDRRTSCARRASPATIRRRTARSSTRSH